MSKSSRPRNLNQVTQSREARSLNSNSTYESEPDLTVDAMSSAIAAELSGSTVDKSTPVSKVFASYNTLPISKFLADCSLYDNQAKGWTPLKNVTGVTQEELLYTPLSKIIQSIFDYFDKGGPKLRWIDETYKKRITHVEDGITILQVGADGQTTPVIPPKSSPDLAIMGRTSRFFMNPAIAERSEYSHCLAPLEVKLEATFKANKKEITQQIGIYARQCFIQQPHRRYVPVVVLTENHAYLNIHDRSGVLRVDSSINYHTDPVTLVRIVLGISSIEQDQKISAFDTRIKWEHGGDWPQITVSTPKEHARSLRLTTTSRASYVYQVVGTPFIRRSARGRGTVCWNAEQVSPPQPNGTVSAVLIKDSWRSSGRQNEWELLKIVKGLAGVGQMVAYEDDTEYPISQFRNHVVNGLYTNSRPYTADRIFCRIVLEAYGRSIKYFQTKLELLHAFYDSVAGHKNIWQKGILHRDISLENILLGKPNAEPGNRGVLIDLDMAIKVDRETNLSGSQFRTGTRAFQSVAVLKSAGWAQASPTVNIPPQDHLDDLESFLYVLSWICMKYNGPGNCIVVHHLEKWEDNDPEICATAKRDFLTAPLSKIQPYFKSDEVFRKLLKGLARLCETHVIAKYEVEEESGSFPDLKTVYASENGSSGKDHDKFLEIIKAAIVALEQLPPERVLSPSSDAAPIEGPANERNDIVPARSTLSKNRDASTSTSNLDASLHGGEKKRKIVESHLDEQGDKKRSRGSHEASASRTTRRTTTQQQQVRRS
ncbi:hypothetical protein JR316_0004262 [Psilocybe cubensis]|uniref:Uncharacterized protein n=2 Tax=Psilocybe cubensis TaxID=181762 RepID=A0ACB8H389_PSICU|nr:hypothetical protein JR316_0004262 [Psilocybe cubensis]KAH9482167.1 hypothetical protein JR316_0004262 [Psilocybe cubensis]